MRSPYLCFAITHASVGDPKQKLRLVYDGPTKNFPCMLEMKKSGTQTTGCWSLLRQFQISTKPSDRRLHTLSPQLPRTGNLSEVKSQDFVQVLSDFRVFGSLISKSGRTDVSSAGS